MHGVYAVKHRLWIRITRRLKLMTAPLILRPVVPVLYDVVNRDMALTELSQVVLNLARGRIALTTLPEAKHPLRIERSLTCQRAIATNHLVEVLSGDEVVVHILRHLTPDRELFALFLVTWFRNAQTAVGLTAVRTPLDTELHLLAFLEFAAELIGIRIPSRAPTLRHNLLAIDVNLDIA